jgi:DNA-binding IclR family transcriptional regulator
MQGASPSESAGGVEAVDRALTILDAFVAGDTGLTLKTLADRTGLNKATLLRLAASLERFGYLFKDGEGLYHVGPAAWRLGSVFRQNLRMGPLVRPVLSALVAQTGESASFYVQRGVSGVCLYRVNSPRLARDHIEEGEIIPLGIGSTGQVLDAYSIRAGSQAAAIRKRGHYVSRGERDPEVAGVSAPVLGGEGELIGAVSLSGLLNRFNDSTIPGYIDEVTKAALAIRTALGYGSAHLR